MQARRKEKNSEERGRSAGSLQKSCWPTWLAD